MKKSGYEEVLVPAGQVWLKGDLFIPEHAHALVIFSHGSGSSRKSQRNRMVAEHLHEHGIGTLLFDLLTEEEDLHYSKRFDIDLLTSRLVQTTQWLETKLGKNKYAIGLFGASTGAASALKAAAALPGVKAVVSRGGRPDMAREALVRVKAPVLLIVGGHDPDVLKLNQYAYEQLHCQKKLVIIEGATHLFEEPGTLEQVADEAASWFKRYLLTNHPAHVQRQN
ncbi:MAG: dienelactone hydrolase family protein [Bacteroidetes bacterium]|nr:dienelactone hydrolase family protein [Bacteroidota bacterium]